ncbi:MAG: hypothetical protein A3D57_03515, partial [Candidatus Sungbacteria bacterium RIFCSPHIGHO2_02_FULL_46_12]
PNGISGPSFVIGSTTATNFIVTNGGNVGIGTTSPRTKFTIGGATAGSGQQNGIAGMYESLTFNPSSGGTQYGNRLVVTNSPTVSANTAIGENIRIIDNSSLANTVRGIEVNTAAGGNLSGNNVGILATAKTFGIQGVSLGTAAGTFVPAGVYAELQSTSTGNALRVYSGTSTAATLLSVFEENSLTSGGDYTGTAVLVNMAKGTSDTFQGKFVEFQDSDAPRFTVASTGRLWLYQDTLYMNNATSIVRENRNSWSIATTSVDGTLPILSIDGLNGRVGIGTSSPSSKLSIEGTCVDTGGGCADYAELYPATEPVDPGDIVAVDASVPGSVRKATANTAVIGIVSSNPAITIEGSSLQFLTGIGYKNNPLKPSVALVGRVPVKVSTEGGAITIGDRIALSSIPGRGMKATTSGTSVGVALSSFDQTKATTTEVTQKGDIVYIGTVMVFVNLGYHQLDNGEALMSSLYSSLATTSASGTPVALPTWAIDPATGEVKGGSYVDFKGKDIVNARGIFSENGTWSIDEAGVLVAHEVRAQKIITQELEVGSSAKPSGITVYDTVTKQPSCLTVTAGIVNAAAGACPEDTSGIAPSGTMPQTNSEQSASPAVFPDSFGTSAPPETSSTTPAINTTAASPAGSESSTTPIIDTGSTSTEAALPPSDIGTATAP